MNRTVLKGLLLTMAVLVGGCVPSKYIYVDEGNTTGPWDGSQAKPYATIQQGLNAAVAGKYDGVKIYGGVYNENVVVEDGLELQRVAGTTTVLLQGKTSSPTITAKGNNYIGGLMVNGGTVGIHIGFAKALTVSNTPLTIVTGNIIESGSAIHVQTGSSLAFGHGVRKTPMVAIKGNWIREGSALDGVGIRVDLVGPKTGEMALRLDINDNIIWKKSTGIALSAKGQGANPGGFVRANITGEVANNLLYGCSLSCVRMDSENQGDASILIFGNSIIYGKKHAIIATATSGPNGDASTHPNITNNILAYNGGAGYYEFDKKTSASDLNNNLFHKNGGGHYHDLDTGKTLSTVSELNTAIVQKKVVFYSGGGNLLGDPQFESGLLYWDGQALSGKKAGGFFLTQQGSKKSPGIDAGLGSALDGGVSKKTTSTAYSNDSGKSDLGYHYTK